LVLSGTSSSNLNAILQNAWANGADPENIFVNAPLKRVISQATLPQQNRNIGATDRRLVGAVDFYDSDFGTKEVILDRWVGSSTSTATGTAASAYAFGNHLWCLTRAFNRLAYLRPLMHTLVGKRGDSVAGMVMGEFTLECLNPSGNYFAYGLSST
jgi:hypothetical protein